MLVINIKTYFGIGFPLQYSGLEKSIDCIVHGVAKSRTWLSDFTSLSHIFKCNMTFIERDLWRVCTSNMFLSDAEDAGPESGLGEQCYITLTTAQEHWCVALLPHIKLHTTRHLSDNDKPEISRPQSGSQEMWGGPQGWGCLVYSLLVPTLELDWLNTRSSQSHPQSLSSHGR